MTQTQPQPLNATEAFMNAIGPECGGCKNLATNLCPFFKAATEGKPEVAKAIQIAVVEMQAGKNLSECDGDAPQAGL